MNDPEVVISVKNLSKSYRIWRDPSARLKAPLFDALESVFTPHKRNGNSDIEPDNPEINGRIYNTHKYYHDFCALQGVDLELRKGQSLGIIGKNGSGKSTLLQMIAGTLNPTSGTVFTRGRVAALLELGAGFNDEFTGRENVYLNASILGLTRDEIDERFERITEFANIGDFIDQPIKTYSSGMRVRLAFAVQAEIDPDILIIDEALAVGDIRFTMKCIRRMKELQENDTTLLFVSHDLSSIVNFCQEVMWINEGQVVRKGNPRSVALEYSNFMHYGVTTEPGDEESSDQVAEKAAELSDSFNDEESESQTKRVELDLTVEGKSDLPTNIPWEDVSGLPCDGTGKVKFLHAALQNRKDPSQSKLFEGDEEVRIFLHLNAKDSLDQPIVCADIYDIKGNLIFGCNTSLAKIKLHPLEADKSYIFEFGCKIPKLRNGDYTLLFGLSNGTYENHEHICGIAECLTFEVRSDNLSQRHHIVSFDDYYVESFKVQS